MKKTTTVKKVAPKSSSKPMKVKTMTGKATYVKTKGTKSGKMC